jgi:hypothetical protein
LKLSIVRYKLSAIELMTQDNIFSLKYARNVICMTNSAKLFIYLFFYEFFVCSPHLCQIDYHIPIYLDKICIFINWSRQSKLSFKILSLETRLKLIFRAILAAEDQLENISGERCKLTTLNLWFTRSISVVCTAVIIELIDTFSFHTYWHFITLLPITYNSVGLSLIRRQSSNVFYKKHNP